MTIHRWYQEILDADYAKARGLEIEVEIDPEDAVRDREIAQADAYADAQANGEQIGLFI